MDDVAASRATRIYIRADLGPRVEVDSIEDISSMSTEKGHRSTERS